jgi:hypothetical protein
MLADLDGGDDDFPVIPRLCALSLASRNVTVVTMSGWKPSSRDYSRIPGNSCVPAG